MKAFIAANAELIAVLVLVGGLALRDARPRSIPMIQQPGHTAPAVELMPEISLGPPDELAPLPAETI
ncbi:MAG: hypothetical protein FJW40_25430 [Acidobacteria bacterium]|nr:hypothetical protein [Acidobacteriota bacterium]